MREGATKALASLRAALEARGDAVCWRSPQSTLTAAEVLDRMRRAEDNLSRAGAGTGDVVAIWRLPVSHVLPCLLSAWSLGLVTYLADAREPTAALARQLDEVGARLLIAADLAAAPSGSVSVVEAERLLASAGGDLQLTDRESSRLPDGSASLLRTSGSSGRPKLAVHGLAQHVSAARDAGAAVDLREGDRWLLVLPHHHVGGLSILFRALLGGAEVAQPDRGQQVSVALEELAPTHVSLVPTQLMRLLNEGCGEALARPRTVLLGGAALSFSLRRRALQEGIRLAVSYGSTESTAFLAMSAEPGIVARARSAGRVLPGREVEVAADGELRIGGPTLFLGYLEEGGVRDPRDADGRFATGDLGRFDAEGVLYVLGRRDRLFTSGGENINPGEIEAVLESVPGVDAAVVAAAPDAEFGHRPVAFLVMESAAPAREEIVARLRRDLPGYKVPIAFYRIDHEILTLKARPEDLLDLAGSGRGAFPL